MMASTPANRLHDGFPEPTIIPPRKHHTHSIILLHGRGDDGPSFGSELITTPLLDSNPDTNTLPKSFPTLRFIFPSARLSGATAYGGRPMPQWFDLMALGTENERKDLEREGLREAARYMHRLIDDEAKAVGVGNVIVGGMSQGAAAALCALVGYDDEQKGQLGGYVGISGWLPFCDELKEFGGQEDTAEAGLRAVHFTRDCILGLPPIHPTPVKPVGCLSTPIWMAHGAKDEKVSVKLGESAALMMQSLGWDVTFMEYEDMGHWFTPIELADLAIFLSARAGVPESGAVASNAYHLLGQYARN